MYLSCQSSAVLVVQIYKGKWAMRLLVSSTRHVSIGQENWAWYKVSRHACSEVIYAFPTFLLVSEPYTERILGNKALS